MFSPEVMFFFVYVANLKHMAILWVLVGLILAYSPLKERDLSGREQKGKITE